MKLIITISIVLIVTGVCFGQKAGEVIITGIKEQEWLLNKHEKFASKNIVSLCIRSINYNQIDFEYIGKLESLNKLSLISVNKVDIVDCIKKLSSLKNLDTVKINHSKIKELPDNLFLLNHLEYIDLSFNKIKHIAYQKYPVTIKSLNFSNNKIKSIENIVISECEYINLSFNPLQIFPYYLSNTNGLKVLEIGNWKKRIKLKSTKITGFRDLIWLTYYLRNDMLNIRSEFFVDNPNVEVSNISW